MVKQVCVPIVVAAALIAGCGSSSSPASTQAVPPGAHTTSAVPSSTAAGGSASTPAAGAESLATEITTCTSTAARSKLSTKGKSTYLALCKQAVNSNSPGIKRTVARQCQEIIRTTVPAAAQSGLDAICQHV